MNWRARVWLMGACLLLAALLSIAAAAKAETPEAAATRAVAAFAGEKGMAFLDRMPVNCPDGADGVIWMFPYGSAEFRGCWKRIQDTIIIIWDDGDVGQVPASRFKWLPSS